MRILLIEDNQEIRENTCEILELDGFEVITAANGKEGLELARSEMPDLIICDIMMPIMDGYTVLYFLSKEPKTTDIPFIFISAKAERVDLRKGMEMGADDYITKPFEDVELISAVRNRLKKKEMIRKVYSKGIEGLDQLVSDAEGDRVLQSLTANREVREYKKKAEIYREGDYPLYLYFLQKGKAKAFKTNDVGKELIINLYNEGDFIGYVDLLRESHFSETLQAMENSEVVLIPRKVFSDLILKNPSVALKMVQLVSQNVQQMETDLLKLAYNSVRKRVSDSLLFFMNGSLEALKISREDLAARAGTSLETAIRTLSDFKDEGLIDIVTGKISILDREKLENLRN